MASKRPYSFYAVKKRCAPGIYKTWAECETQVKGFPDAIYKGFRTRADAKKFLSQEIEARPHSATRAERKQLQMSRREWDRAEAREQISRSARNDESQNDDAGRVIIYTDGSSIGNPGPGGYAAVMLYGAHRKEARGGFRLTTNNRMEIMAALVGLEMLRRKCAVTIYTDSKYLRDAMMNGWLTRWMKNGWRTSEKRPVANVDLWTRLWAQAQKHNVKFEWVRGHAGNAENERCDALATQMAARADLPPDDGYEAGLMEKRK